MLVPGFELLSLLSQSGELKAPGLESIQDSPMARLQFLMRTSQGRPFSGKCLRIDVVRLEEFS